MTNEEFARTLQRWRKGRQILQKEAAEWFGVPLSTYRGWEYDQHRPVKICIECILKKIKENQPSK